MTTDIEPIDTSSQPLPLDPAATFGQRLRSARTAMNMESKDAASHLRLNERIILLIEDNNFNNGIAPTFMRGYIRSYAKLLNIPEHEVKKVTDTIKHEAPAQRIIAKPVATTRRNTDRVTSHFMNIFTALIVITMVGLIGTWWYSHNKPNSFVIAANQTSHTVNTTENTVETSLPIQISSADTAPGIDTAPTTQTPAAETPTSPAPSTETAQAIQTGNETSTKTGPASSKPAKAEPSSNVEDEDDLDSDI